MEILGTEIIMTSSKTGMRVKQDFMIARCSPSSFAFQKFLIELYMKDFEFYKVYTELILMYLSGNPNGLTEAEILENKTIISTIAAMHIVRDKEQYEKDLLEHTKLQDYVNKLNKKQKP